MGLFMAKNRRKHAWFVFTVMVTLYIQYCKFEHLVSGVCVAHCLRRLPPIPFSPGSGTSAGTALFFVFLNSLFFLICFFFHLRIYFFQLT